MSCWYRFRVAPARIPHPLRKTPAAPTGTQLMSLLQGRSSELQVQSEDGAIRCLCGTTLRHPPTWWTRHFLLSLDSHSLMLFSSRSRTSTTLLESVHLITSTGLTLLSRTRLRLVNRHDFVPHRVNFELVHDFLCRLTVELHRCSTTMRLVTTENFPHERVHVPHEIILDNPLSLLPGLFCMNQSRWKKPSAALVLSILLLSNGKSGIHRGNVVTSRCTSTSILVGKSERIYFRFRPISDGSDWEASFSEDFSSSESK